MKVGYFILCILFLSNCSKSEFYGNWAFCDSDGMYGEIYFKENYFEMIYEANGNFNTTYDYTVKNDTLYINLTESETINYKGYFKYLSNKKISFFYKYNEDSVWSFFEMDRLDVSLSLETEKLKRHEDFLNRLENADCKKPTGASL